MLWEGSLCRLIFVSCSVCLCTLLSLHGAECLGPVVQHSVVPDREELTARRPAEEDILLAIVLLQLVAREVVDTRKGLVAVRTLGKTVIQYINSWSIFR